MYLQFSFPCNQNQITILTQKFKINLLQILIEKNAHCSIHVFVF